MTYLRLEGISKRFGDFVANDNIDLSVSRGTIHALLGENGAGKTTLMNILCGLYQPDAGKIFIDEKPVKFSSPKDAIACGIGTIHQHFTLVPQLSVTENIILGSGFYWRLDGEKRSREIAELARVYGFDIDPQAKVGDLPVGVQQRVEILKTLYRRSQILILDEPTAVLTPQEVESFGRILRELAANGKTLIFISHKLEEVMNFCDRITVLRQGQAIATVSTDDTTREQLATLMVGREIAVDRHKLTQESGKVILDLRQIAVKSDRFFVVLRDISFQIHAGEIFGIAGVDGNGQRELAEAIAGVIPIHSGEIWVEGKNITHWSLQQRIKQLNFGYIPENRQTQGLILEFTISRNLILKLFKYFPFCCRWLLQHSAIQTHAETAIENFDIRAAHPGVKAGQLSGGNQQKIVLARELSGNPTLIIAMQPTRGLDVGASAYVQQRLLQERNRGAAILYISTELEEIMTVSDRIAVMYAGTFADILEAKTATVERVGLLMTSGKQTK